MTMERMVSYLENKGFTATKKYDPRNHHYIFDITKDNDFHYVDTFEYPVEVTWDQKDILQRDFLNKLIYKYETELYRKECVEGVAKMSYLMKLVGADDVYLVTDGLKVPVKINEIDQSYDAPCTFSGTELYTSEYLSYVNNDIDTVNKAINIMKNRNKVAYGSIRVPIIKDVIFSEPATIVFWKDGTKTVVKCQNEEYDPEKGIAMAIAKKVYGNGYHYYDDIDKFVKRYNKRKCK